MSAHRITRRELLRLAGSGLVALLVACDSQTVEETAGVETTATGGFQVVKKLTPEHESGGQFTYPLAFPQEGVCPLSSSLASCLTHGRLVDAAVDGSTHPNLAGEVEVSPDFAQFTFNLRKGIRWHDEEPFTARDVVHTFKYYLHPDLDYSLTPGHGLLAIKGAAAYLAGEADEVAGLAAPNDFTVVCELERSNSAWLLKVSRYNILPEHIWGGVPPAKASRCYFEAFSFDKKYTVGTGPFQYVEGKQNDFVRLERYDDYWGGKPYLDTILFRAYYSEEETWRALVEDEISVLELLGERKAQARQIPGVNVVERDATGFHYFQVNMRHPWLADVRMRQAIIHAIDRWTLAQELFYGDREPWYSPFPQSRWLNGHMAVYSYDPGAAEALLAEAAADGAWDPNRELVLTYYRYLGTQAEHTMEAIQSCLADVGIKTCVAHIQSRLAIESGEYDLFYVSYPAFLLDPSWWMSAITCRDDDYSDVWQGTHADVCKRMVALFEQGVAVAGYEARKSIYDEIQQLWGEYLPAIILWRDKSTLAIRDDVGGIDTDAQAYLTNLTVSYHKAHLWHKIAKGD